MKSCTAIKWFVIWTVAFVTRIATVIMHLWAMQPMWSTATIKIALTKILATVKTTGHYNHTVLHVLLGYRKLFA